MNSGEKRYIWESSDWPEWRYDLAALASPLAEANRSQGLLLGRLTDVGVALRDQASLQALTEDVVKTSAIEGDVLTVASVRCDRPSRDAWVWRSEPLRRWIGRLRAWSIWRSTPLPTPQHP